MDPRSFFFPPTEAETKRMELILRTPEGAPWCLTISPGIERFIGYYPRLDGIDPGGPLLEFTRF
jgi:hypothetical protein